MTSSIRRALGPSALAAVLLAAPLSGQLRPLDPLDLSTLDRPGGTLLVGGTVLGGQRVSLAGMEGRLLEIGTFAATWSYERIGIRIGGTAFRWFDGKTVYSEPVDDTRPPDGSARTDAGDLRLSTIVMLTPNDQRITAGFRFGVRLPTTDNREGLGRDQSDFFLTVATRLVDGPWDASLEFGGGVNGTRDPAHEQIDPILFAGSAVFEAGVVDPILSFAGQHDPRSSRDRRGNENVGEVRLGLRVGTERWLSVSGVRGWTSVSPDLGVIVQFGTRF